VGENELRAEEESSADSVEVRKSEDQLRSWNADGHFGSDTSKKTKKLFPQQHVLTRGRHGSIPHLEKYWLLQKS